jgi:DNA-binding NtrC family response regulator
VSADATEALMAYRWPGNVRQLARVLEYMVALASSPEIVAADLPPDIQAGYSDVIASTRAFDAAAGAETLRAWSGRYVRLVLDRCDGNKRRACEVLDISYHTLKGYLDEDDGPPKEEGAGPLAMECRN